MSCFYPQRGQCLVTNPAVRLYRRLGFTYFPNHYMNDKDPNHVVFWKPFRKDLIEKMTSEQPAGAKRTNGNRTHEHKKPPPKKEEIWQGAGISPLRIVEELVWSQ